MNRVLATTALALALLAPVAAYADDAPVIADPGVPAAAVNTITTEKFDENIKMMTPGATTKVQLKDGSIVDGVIIWHNLDMLRIAMAKGGTGTVYHTGDPGWTIYRDETALQQVEYSNKKAEDANPARVQQYLTEAYRDPPKPKPSTAVVHYDESAQLLCLPQLDQLGVEVGKHINLTAVGQMPQRLKENRIAGRSAASVRFLADLGKRRISAESQGQKWAGLTCDEGLERAIEYMLNDDAS